MFSIACCKPRPPVSKRAAIPATALMWGNHYLVSQVIQTEEKELCIFSLGCYSYFYPDLLWKSRACQLYITFWTHFCPLLQRWLFSAALRTQMKWAYTVKSKFLQRALSSEILQFVSLHSAKKKKPVQTAKLQSLPQNSKSIEGWTRRILKALSNSTTL